MSLAMLIWNTLLLLYNAKTFIHWKETTIHLWSPLCTSAGIVWRKERKFAFCHLPPSIPTTIYYTKSLHAPFIHNTQPLFSFLLLSLAKTFTSKPVYVCICTATWMLNSIKTTQLLVDSLTIIFSMLLHTPRLP